MKEHEEKELNEEMKTNAVESPVKPRLEANGEEGADMLDATAEEQEGDPPSILTDVAPNGEGTTDNNLQAKVIRPFDIALGALGQVRAKVEVCKDESVGKSSS